MTTNSTSESESVTRKAGSLASVDFDVFGSDASAEETAASEVIDFDLSADATHEAVLSEPTAAPRGELDFDLLGEAGKAGETEAEDMLAADATRIVRSPSARPVVMPERPAPIKPTPTPPPALTPVSVPEPGGSGKLIAVIMGLAIAAAVIWWLLR